MKNTMNQNVAFKMATDYLLEQAFSSCDIRPIRIIDLYELLAKFAGVDIQGCLNGLSVKEIADMINVDLENAQLPFAIKPLPENHETGYRYDVSLSKYFASLPVLHLESPSDKTLIDLIIYMDGRVYLSPFGHEECKKIRRGFALFANPLFGMELYCPTGYLPGLSSTLEYYVGTLAHDRMGADDVNDLCRRHDLPYRIAKVEGTEDTYEVCDSRKQHDEPVKEKC